MNNYCCAGTCHNYVTNEHLAPPRIMFMVVKFDLV